MNICVVVNGEGFLTINNVTLEDAGSYECQAVNAVGSARLHNLLQIVGKNWNSAHKNSIYAN